MMYRKVIILFFLALTNRMSVCQSTTMKIPKTENECTLFKTIYDLNWDLKVSISSLETWKSEIDKHMQNLITEKNTLKTKMEELISKTQGYAVKLGDIDTKVETLSTELETQKRNINNTVSSVQENLGRSIEDIRSNVEEVESTANKLVNFTRYSDNRKTGTSNLDTARRLLIGGDKEQMEAAMNLTDKISSKTKQQIGAGEERIMIKLDEINRESTFLKTKVNTLELKIDGMKDEILTDVDSAKSRVDRVEKAWVQSQAYDFTMHLRNHSTGGTMYKRWGASTCGNKSRHVYSGFLGGGHYDYTGAAVNALCLPNDPDHTSVSGTATNIYAGQYYMSNKIHFNLPCAVCDTGNRSKVFMLPAKSTCPVGWNIEYSGMLSAGHYSHKSSTEYICLDASMETIGLGNHRKALGKLFYFVTPSCDSMPCPAYANSKILTCVVCSG